MSEATEKRSADGNNRKHTKPSALQEDMIPQKKRKARNRQKRFLTTSTKRNDDFIVPNCPSDSKHVPGDSTKGCGAKRETRKQRNAKSTSLSASRFVKLDDCGEYALRCACASIVTIQRSSISKSQSVSFVRRRNEVEALNKTTERSDVDFGSMRVCIRDKNLASSIYYVDLRRFVRSTS